MLNFGGEVIIIQRLCRTHAVLTSVFCWSQRIPIPYPQKKKRQAGCVAQEVGAVWSLANKHADKKTRVAGDFNQFLVFLPPKKIWETIQSWLGHMFFFSKWVAQPPLKRIWFCQTSMYMVVLDVLNPNHLRGGNFIDLGHFVTPRL